MYLHIHVGEQIWFFVQLFWIRTEEKGAKIQGKNSILLFLLLLLLLFFFVITIINIIIKSYKREREREKEERSELIKAYCTKIEIHRISSISNIIS